MEPSAWQVWIDRIPIVLAGLGVVIVILTLLLWWKRYGRLGARIHYTLFALAVLEMLRLFYYWNIYSRAGETSSMRRPSCYALISSGHANVAPLSDLLLPGMDFLAE